MEQKEKLIEFIGNFAIDSRPAKEICSVDFDEKFADYLIANGVVIPVRCEECTHGEDDGTGIRCHKHNKQFGDYDFCSCGERRSNNK